MVINLSCIQCDCKTIQSVWIRQDPRSTLDDPIRISGPTCPTNHVYYRDRQNRKEWHIEYHTNREAKRKTKGTFIRRMVVDTSWVRGEVRTIVDWSVHFSGTDERLRLVQNHQDIDQALHTVNLVLFALGTPEKFPIPGK